MGLNFTEAEAAALLKSMGIDLVKDAENLEHVDRDIEFEILSRVKPGEGTILRSGIEKGEDGEDIYILSGVASSTIKDRHGDTILPSALIDMERAANSNLTMFLNHSYDVPEDVAGSVRKASISSTGVDESGAPVYDLDYEFKVNRVNKRAEETFKAIKGGTKLGLSIGARIPEGGAVRNKKTGALLIAHVDLLETSVVGVPANPKSWVEAINKAYKNPVTKLFPGITLETHEVPDAEDVVASTTPDPTPEPEPTPDPAPEPVEASAEPDIAESTAPSQDAPESTPGDDGADASTDVAAAAATPEAPVDLSKASTPELVELLVQSQTSISQLAKQLLETNAKLQAAEQRAATAERERDNIAAVAKDHFADVAQIIHRLGSLPVGQRASFKRIQKDFEDGLDSASDIYGEEIVALLRSKT